MTPVGSIAIPGRPVSLNAERSASRWQRAALTADVRRTAELLWRNGVNAGKFPRALDRIAVNVRVTAKDGRWHQDIGNCMPSAKAAVDGLVDAGLIPDDTDRHLIRLTFEPTEITGTDALIITIHAQGGTP